MHLEFCLFSNFVIFSKFWMFKTPCECTSQFLYFSDFVDFSRFWWFHESEESDSNKIHRRGHKINNKYCPCIWDSINFILNYWKLTDQNIDTNGRTTEKIQISGQFLLVIYAHSPQFLVWQQKIWNCEKSEL